MKLTFAVDIDVDNDWDDSIFSMMAERDGVNGRKDFIEKALRRTVMASMTRDVTTLLLHNSVTVTGICVGEPSWDGWDNDRIARAVGIKESSS